MKAWAVSLNLLLIFSLSSALAQTPSAEQLLARDIMKGSKVLSKDISLYNYYYFNGVHAEFQTEKGRNAFIQRYLATRAGTFWSPDFTDANPKNYAAGAGLYLAIDPHISRTFGNYFIQMDVPKGTRFINVVAPIPVKSDTQEALVREGITTQSQLAELLPKSSGFYRDTLRVMVLPQHLAFRKLVQKIFLQNELQFIEYNFNTSLKGFCSRHSYSAFAFVGLANPTNIPQARILAPYDKIAMHSAEYSLPNRTSAESLQQEAALKYRQVLENIGNMREQGHKNITEYILREYSPEEYQNIKAHTFSCEDEYARK